MIPPAVLSECRAHAQEMMANGKPISRMAGVVIVLLWVTLGALCTIWVYTLFV
jgi:hypothetical protein